MAKDYFYWGIPFPKSLKHELDHLALDEDKTTLGLCKPEIEDFIASLVKKRETILSIRAKQKEEAQIVADHPMIVSGLPAIDPLGSIEV